MKKERCAINYHSSSSSLITCCSTPFPFVAVSILFTLHTTAGDGHCCRLKHLRRAASRFTEHIHGQRGRAVWLSTARLSMSNRDGQQRDDRGGGGVRAKNSWVGARVLGLRIFLLFYLLSSRSSGSPLCQPQFFR